MKKWMASSFVLAVLIVWAIVTVQAKPNAPGEDLGTGFTYQGQLNLDGQPVDNTCDFQFSLYDDELGNVQIGATQTITDVQVSSGLFTIQLDFGAGAFQGDARWLGIQAQCQGDGDYTDLGLQALTAAPYALALPGLWTQQNVTSTNLIGGYSGNSVEDGVVGATIGGGGDSNHLNQVLGDYATVGGGVGNIAHGTGSFIGGGGYGSGNKALGIASTIGGGFGNVVTATGDYATIGGGQGNGTSGSGSTVGGGGSNNAGNDYATVGGGWYNAASGRGATIPGGYENIAGGVGAFIGGGGYDGSTLDGNEALGAASTIGGGLGNVVTATVYYATIGGGSSNTASGSAATVGGGSDNVAGSDWATVGGGYGHNASGDSATVGGGYDNAASGDVATVGGGYANTASGTGTFIGGGGYDGSIYDGNEALGDASTIGGGLGNVITTAGDYATVGGGHDNAANGDSATVGGGDHNTASGWAATVSGGVDNTANNWQATVGGGHSNTASGIGATVGGGGYDGMTYNGNEALGNAATIGGGAGNVVTSSVYYATIGGGHSNVASGGAATVGGGEDNIAGGVYATVPGGYANTASGDYSFAAGRRAQALHDGTIILADSNDFDFASLTPNTFKVRATGGIRFVLGIDDNGGPTWSCLVNYGNSWSCSSDRNLKENLDLVDGGEVLQRLAEMPVYTWNGKEQDPALRHMGPMAQDFYAAFNLGGDDTHIATIDLDGVALAAIQGLYAQNEMLEKENANLHRRVDDLDARLSALEAQVAGGSAASSVQVNLLPGAGLFLVGGVGLWLVCSRQRSEFKGEDGR